MFREEDEALAAPVKVLRGADGIPYVYANSLADALIAQGFLHAQETTRAVIRGLAHEIKNPLGGVRGAAQLLARELPGEELAEYTNIIIREADRLRDLVDQLLGPNQQLKLQSLNIHEVLEHVRNLRLFDDVVSWLGERLTFDTPILLVTYGGPSA